ncbi:MAG: hypothetical protein EOS37_09210 [Mesorhizobium sp.]|nr:MAG: hypothetical protein EOS37_09210 [Mesorhizobium sp.]
MLGFSSFERPEPAKGRVVSPKATDEGCSRERRRLTPLEHPSSVSALRADPPSPTRGEGKSRLAKRIPPAILSAKIILHTGKLVSRSEEGFR